MYSVQDSHSISQCFFFCMRVDESTQTAWMGV